MTDSIEKRTDGKRAVGLWIYSELMIGAAGTRFLLERIPGRSDYSLPPVHVHADVGITSYIVLSLASTPRVSLPRPASVA